MLLYPIKKVFGRVIEFSVLCERIISEENIKLTEFVILKTLDEYNQYFQGTEISFHLHSFMDFTKYSQNHDFANFGYLNESNIDERVNKLKDVPINLIILLSSTENMQKFKKASICNARYFKTFENNHKSDNISLFALAAIKEWIERAFRVKLPNLLEQNHSLRVKLSRNVQLELQACDNLMKEDAIESSSTQHNIESDSGIQKYRIGNVSKQSKEIEPDVRIIKRQIFDEYNKRLTKKFPSIGE